MEPERYLELHELMCDRARSLSERKGHDYSGEEDTLANLKRTEALGITSAPEGVLVRLGDKLSRLVELLQADPEVSDESRLDTVLDTINYANLLAALMVERGEMSIPPEWEGKWDAGGKRQAGCEPPPDEPTDGDGADGEAKQSADPPNASWKYNADWEFQWHAGCPECDTLVGAYWDPIRRRLPRITSCPRCRTEVKIVAPSEVGHKHIDEPMPDESPEPDESRDCGEEKPAEPRVRTLEDIRPGMKVTLDGARQVLRAGGIVCLTGPDEVPCLLRRTDGGLEEMELCRPAPHEAHCWEPIHDDLTGFPSRRDHPGFAFNVVSMDCEEGGAR